MDGDMGSHYGQSGGGGNNNWDLDAVVRLARGGAGRVAPAPPPFHPSAALPPPPPPPQLLHQPDVLAAGAVMWQPPLPYLPLLPYPNPNVVGVDLSQPFFAVPRPPHQPHAQLAYEAPAPAAQAEPDASGGGGSSSRPKRKSRSKKAQEKKVVTRVPADSPVADRADRWAWRKYGQKPIMGSPHVRSYYRCSTDMSCRARKKVERCAADPAALIITYIGEHTPPAPLNRHYLAGTSRYTPLPHVQPQPAAAATPASGVLPATAPLWSPPTAEFEDEEDDDAVAVRVLIQDMKTAPEDALVYHKPADEPVAPGNACGGGVGGGDGPLFAMPGAPDICSSWTNVGGEGTAAAPTIVNVVQEASTNVSAGEWRNSAAATNSWWRC
ncbi:hypothetical protein ACP4OV_012896 [Aristida adscensionis]